LRTTTTPLPMKCSHLGRVLLGSTVFGWLVCLSFFAFYWLGEDPSRLLNQLFQVASSQVETVENYVSIICVKPKTVGKVFYWEPLTSSTRLIPLEHDRNLREVLFSVKARDNWKWSTKRLSQDNIEVLLYSQNRASSPFKRVLLDPKARMKNSDSQTFVSMIKIIIL